MAQLRFEPYKRGFLAAGSGESLLVKGGELHFGGSKLKLLFAGNRCPCPVEILEREPGTTSYFIGNNPRFWRTAVPRYRRIRYRNVYEGIDVVFYINGQRLEFDLAVSPDADPTQVAMRFPGAKTVSIDPGGNLTVKNAERVLYLHRPAAYYDGKREGRSVEAHYALSHGTVRFILGARDRTAPLVIDPVLTYSAYVGDANDTTVSRIVVDAVGNTYVVGTRAFNVRGATVSSSDVIVAKLDLNGNIIYTIYLGGKGTDVGRAIAVDSAGSAYVAGSTTSPNFPLRHALEPRPRGAFLSKISADGATLLQSTYFGGAGRQDVNSINAIAVDVAGNAYVAGETDDASFPVTIGAFQAKPFVSQSAPPLASTAFVSKVSSGGEALNYSTFLGGSRTLCAGGSSCLNIRKFDRRKAIAVDASGNVYVAGVTNAADFPTTPGAFQVQAAGQTPFVTKLNASGTALTYSTLLGGSSVSNGSMIIGGGDEASAIVVDRSGDAFVAGKTASATFPTTADAFQARFGGPIPPTSIFQLPPTDAFISKLNATGTALLYSTYLGGSGVDEALGLAVDAEGDAYVTGITRSPEFPNTDQTFPTGSTFVTKLNPSGSAVLYSATFPEGFSGQDVALDASGRLHLAGHSGIVSVLDLTASSSPAILGIGSAAGGALSGRVAPGELVSILGTGIGPNTPLGLTVDASGLVSKSLGDTQVLFDGIPAPLLYVSNKQVNAIAPYGTAGRVETRVRVTFKGISTRDFRFAVAPAAPEIFRHSDGSAAALNADLTLNSAGNPAKLGSIVAIYATGAGELNPPGVDGAINTQLAVPNLPVSVEVASVPAEVVFAGAAPGLVSGVMQINFRLPDATVVRPGTTGVVLKVGSFSSAAATLYVAQ